MTFYDEIGGEPTIRRIVDTFYDGVANDPVLRPMYPEDDLAPAAERLTLFLSQYWGGPSTYNELRGHPRLRIRHAPFKVNEEARDRWLGHFAQGLVAVDLTEEQRAEFWQYVTHAANFLLNSD
ncbi:MAG TPA: globin [Nocardioides sp.]|nr:globin [Nocardioides sp.]